MDGARTAARGDAGFPPRLAGIPRPPERVFLLGPWTHDGPIVAIVGARDATGDGLDLAHDLAAALARRGVAVISGLARGIDAAAHLGALDAGGRSGAVLGTPLDRTYPTDHRELQQRLGGSLGLLSELPPGAAPTRATFALRNRLLAALADAVVLVQGREGSGALRTVRAAQALGRPVGAVPWDPREPHGCAPLALLKSGAADLVRDEGDVLEMLGRDARRASPPEALATSGEGRPTRAPMPPLAPAESRLLVALRRHPEPLERAALRAALTIAEASAALVALELLGRAERLPGGSVRRVRED